MAAVTIRARVGAMIEVWLDPGTDTRHAKLYESLKRALSYPNPELERRARLRLDMRWTDKEICFLETLHDRVVLPRGSVTTLRALAEQAGLGVRFEDARVSHEAASFVEPVLRDYQAAAVDSFERRTQGYIVFPTGGGKTFTGLAAIARVGQPALVLVHTLDLAKQWADETRKLLGIEPGILAGGTRSEGLITIATVQSLARLSRTELDELMASFGTLVVDEVHLMVSKQGLQVITACPAKYRLGFTATPEIENGISDLIPLHFGELLARKTYEELIAAGVLVAPEVRIIETGFSWTSTLPEKREDRRPGAESQEYQAILYALTRDKARTDLIVADVVAEARHGARCLVLGGWVEFCETLASRIGAEGIEAALLVGKTSAGKVVPKKHRAALLDRARAGELPVLVATSLADVGLDVPILDRLFLVFPSKAHGRTTQRMGRIMRIKEGKQGAAIHDYCDKRVPVLRRHYLERRKLYSELLGVPASKLGSRGDR